MQYVVRHLTRFTYAKPVSESVMELRMQPSSSPRQRSLRFDVSTTPRARIFAYRDHLGNAVHYFDIPGHHTRLDIIAEAAVDVAAPAALPEGLPDAAWSELDLLTADAGHHDWLAPSRFAASTPALEAFSRSIGLERTGDPLTLLRGLTRTLSEQFAYEPRTTRVDSPIDHALEARAGVCQDFAHIMTTLVRGLGIPCRYVSGYLAPRPSGHDRAGNGGSGHDPSDRDPSDHDPSDHDRSAESATHAWIEALLPGAGWVGFDPTNNTLAGERHIAVAVGRDYGDVPPTRGVFKGEDGSELAVAVSVTRPESPIKFDDLVPTISWISPERSVEDRITADFLQQQQQQQQQQ